jgi:AcrR family transcriptional regulator
MSAKVVQSEARNRILETASDLFYSQGYRATGINEIIEKSGVAKATFYAHFASKEALALAYLEELGGREVRQIKESVYRNKSAKGKLLAAIHDLEAWLKETGFRGCAFLNIVSEFPDAQNPVRKEAKFIYESVRTVVRDILEDMYAADPAKLRGLTPQEAADDYLLLYAGAIALSALYHDTWPAKAAAKAAGRLAP